MNEITVRVAQNLNFHVTRAPYELFEVHLILAERRFGLAPGGSHRLDEFPVVLDHAHAAAATAPARLEHDGKPYLMGHRPDLSVVRRQGRRGRHHRNARRGRQIAGLDFVSQTPHRVGQRTDEHDVRRGTGLGELGTLGQESIAGVNGIDAGLGGDANDVGNVEIGFDRPLSIAHQIALVGFRPVQREPILARMDGHGSNTEFGGRPHHANGDLAAIGDEQAFDGAQGGKWFHLGMMIAL